MVSIDVTDKNPFHVGPPQGDSTMNKTIALTLPLVALLSMSAGCVYYEDLSLIHI